MIKAIIFDLDETLINRRNSLKSFLNHQFSSIPEFKDQNLKILNFINLFMKLDNNGSVSKDIVYKQLIDDLNIRNIKADYLLNDYMLNFRNHLVLFPYVIETLKNLKNKSFKLGIITNGLISMQSSVINESGLDQYMDTILISEEEGIKKPNIEIFNRALNKLGIKASESIFIGDNPEADIRGAYNAGMHSIWMENDIYDQEPNKSLLSGTFNDYRVLPNLIDKLINT